MQLINSGEGQIPREPERNTASHIDSKATCIWARSLINTFYEDKKKEQCFRDKRWLGVCLGVLSELAASRALLTCAPHSTDICQVHKSGGQTQGTSTDTDDEIGLTAPVILQSQGYSVRAGR